MGWGHTGLGLQVSGLVLDRMFAASRACDSVVPDV